MARNSLARRRRRPSKPATAVNLNEHFSVQRRLLFQAHGIVELTRFAVASKLEDLDEMAIVDALQVATKLISDVCGALEVETIGAND
jgi:hypothetical protein